MLAHSTLRLHVESLWPVPIALKVVSACLQILELQPQLSFHLQQQRLIELVGQGKVEEALDFAQEYLAPQGEGNPAFLQELGEHLAPVQ